MKTITKKEMINNFDYDQAREKIIETNYELGMAFMRNDFDKCERCKNELISLIDQAIKTKKDVYL